MSLAAAKHSSVIRLLDRALRTYQMYLSPLKGATCRFYPSCSEYARQALHRYGLIKGVGMTIARLARCHPFHAGGYDPVK